MKLAIVAMALVGCSSQWAPDSYPVRVVVFGDAKGAAAAIEAGAADWSRAAGAQAFEVSFEPDGFSAWGQVNIHVTTKGLGSDQVGLDEHRFRECSAIILIRPGMAADYTRVAVEHELGHVVLGGGHSKDPRSVMYWHTEPGQVITQADADSFRAEMESTR